MSCRGPVLRLNPRSRTGVSGVGLSLLRIWNKPQVPHFIANCGERTFKFNIQTLGRAEAYRRALRARAAYEQNWRPA